jgi:hypothetical protein
VDSYICSMHHSEAYRARLEKTLRKFFLFAQEKLSIEAEEILNRQKEPDQHLVHRKVGRGDTI